MTNPVTTPHGVIDQEQFAPELYQPFGVGLAVFDIQRLKDGNKDSQSQGERNEEKMIDGGQGKLPP